MLERLRAACMAMIWRPSENATAASTTTDATLPLASSAAAYLPSSLHPHLKSLLVKALSLGPRPRHVGIIMDGNRRFARQRRQPVRVGHEEGFEALKRILSFFLKLEIAHVTVYAFSIENFNRAPTEVDALMDMARLRLAEICAKGALLDQHGIQIRILGRRDLLPSDVQQACTRAERLTKDNKRGILNFCCPYTSQEEMATAMKRAADTARSEGDLSLVNGLAVDHHLYTADSPTLDLLIRTSGVRRLSDFLCWQANDSTVIRILGPNWPDISVMDLIQPLLTYQGEAIARRLCSLFGIAP